MAFWRVVLFLLFTSVLVYPQESAVGRELYAKNSSSVLLLKVLSPTGEEIALGSGFLIGKGQIITNAHVAKAGAVVIEIGPVKIPASIEKTDTTNDLALLKISAEVALTPLTLAKANPKPGDTVYAIGNPEGLEKSISQGLVSAERKLEGRNLLQISSAISHGSSGGPILNSSGEVVGVAVAILQSGQNLNFAIPVSLVRDFLSSRTESSGVAITDLLSRISELRNAQSHDGYSKDADSPYQQKEAEEKQLFQQAYDSSLNNVGDLILLCKTANDLWVTDVALRAAERAHQLRPDSETKLLLSLALSRSVLLKKDDAVRKSSLTRAEGLARQAIDSSKKPTYQMYLRLADVLEDEVFTTESVKYYRLTLAAMPDQESKATALRGLVRQVSDESENDSLFHSLQQVDELTMFDWRQRGEWLSGKRRYSDAAAAYRNAASKFGYYTDWCDAGQNSLFAGDYDAALVADRKCIELGSTRKDSESQMENAHFQIASILNERGVYSEALSHAQEAISFDSTDSFAYNVMANALMGLRRYQEAINAATQAIRLSDGKYAYMHFTLGSAYFKVENWESSRQSFEKAAELDPKDDSAAYNVGICHARLGYYRDAARWYEEVLRRNPNHKERADLQQRIRALRQ